MGNKTKFTASEAIEAIEGMHRKRFYQMVNNGDISYTTEQQGTKETKVFDASELVRVFGDKLRISETRETKHEAEETSFMKQNETSRNTLENTLLEKDINHLHERLADREAQLKEKETLIADIRQERDDWKQQAQKLLLTHQPITSQAPESPSPKKRWWW
jgi:chromosome segregation ATPase